MDYDATEIPRTYDKGRDHGPEVLDLWMNTIASHVEELPYTRSSTLAVALVVFQKRWPATSTRKCSR